ncbi:hypothetical protein [Spirosoma foliorum]|uniref:Uncharacterized protein n=1 Tax=Spirosoma foliorum TaxID=2710596 RepID=A0A7G5H2N4_9BACT|nr:hypothetical protein [Spirosoma foliorum]QMW05376.1 hypothetical protein H3H32_11025 [Spirosoma foliorum]
MANTKYSPEQAAALVASDEPTFILRAKDIHALAAIRTYKNSLVYGEFKDYEGAAKVRECEKLFSEWQANNSDKLQFPTL